MIKKKLSNVACKHGVIDQGKYKNWQVKKFGQKGGITWRSILMLRTKMLRYFLIQPSFYNWNFVAHTKIHCVRGLIKHSHMIFDSKLVHDICAIHWITCTYVEFTSMLEQKLHSCFDTTSITLLQTIKILYILASDSFV